MIESSYGRAATKHISTLVPPPASTYQGANGGASLLAQPQQNHHPRTDGQHTGRIAEQRGPAPVVDTRQHQSVNNRQIDRHEKETNNELLFYFRKLRPPLLRVVGEEAEAAIAAPEAEREGEARPGVIKASW